MALSPAEWISVGSVGTLTVLAGTLGWRAWLASRITPEEAERRRRVRLVAAGKMGDATVLEVRENFVFYTYDVRGVSYTASQDVSALTSVAALEAADLAGPVYVKYDARNPADSIILAEEWSGLMMRKSGVGRLT